MNLDKTQQQNISNFNNIEDKEIRNLSDWLENNIGKGILFIKKMIRCKG